MKKIHISLKIIILVFLLFTSSFFSAKAQDNVGIGTITPHQYSILDLETTNKGLLVPRMSTIERLAIPVNPSSNSLLVYDIDSCCFFFYKAPTTEWISLCDVSTGPPGPIGPIGPTGADGAVGLTGPSGADGADGAVGLTGPSGADGAVGPTGPAGADGDSTGSGWSLTGNDTVPPPIYFIGTKDANDFIIKTNNIENIRVTSGGLVGIGINPPLHKLHVESNIAGVGNYAGYFKNTSTGSGIYGFGESLGIYGKANAPAGIQSYGIGGELGNTATRGAAVRGTLEAFGAEGNLARIDVATGRKIGVYGNADDAGGQFYPGVLFSPKSGATPWATIGMQYLDDDDSTMYYYNGISWIPWTSGGGSSEWTDAGTYVYPNENSNIRVYEDNNIYGFYYKDLATYGGYFKSTEAGADNYGVYGECANTDLFGYGGYFKGGWYGIKAEVLPTGNGIYYGAYGRVSGGSGTNYGVKGYANGTGNNYGIYGSAVNAGGTNYGVYGSASTTDGYGIFGYVSNQDGFGIKGYNAASNGTGIFGSGDNIGGYYLTGGSGGAFSGDSMGVCGFTTVDGNDTWGGYFENEHGSYAYVGGTTAAGTNRKIEGNGTVNTVVDGLNNDKVTMTCPEAPEILFMDYGSGKLLNGKAHINLDPIFTKNIFVNKNYPLRVFIQLEGNCKGVYVTNKTAQGFDVIELQEGNSNVEFSWTVTATRADEFNENGTIFSKNIGQRFAPATLPRHTIKARIVKPPRKDIKENNK